MLEIIAFVVSILGPVITRPGHQSAMGSRQNRGKAF
jgi:hypothetical protein